MKTKSFQEKLILEFTENYIEKLFYSNHILHEQLAYYAAMEITNMRMMTVHDEVESGRLTVPEHPETSTIAMYLKI